jgi:hypothetical protein
MITQFTRAFLLIAIAGSLLACGDDDDASSSMCVAGNAGCPCLEDDACSSEDLTCMAGTCQGTFDVGVTVSNKNARGCDVLVTEQGSRVADATFGETVKGTFVREAPKVALSFISTSDAPIDGNGIQLQLIGAGSDGLQVESVECADRAGKPLEGVTIALKR